jgi:hypothetical protein
LLMAVAEQPDRAELIAALPPRPWKPRAFRAALLRARVPETRIDRLFQKAELNRVILQQVRHDPESVCEALRPQTAPEGARCVFCRSPAARLISSVEISERHDWRGASKPIGPVCDDCERARIAGRAQPPK